MTSPSLRPSSLLRRRWPTGIWLGVTAVVVLLATVAVPFVRSGASGTAQRTRVELTTAYPSAPGPGMLLDLNQLLEIDEPVLDSGTAAWVRPLSDESALLVQPSGATMPAGGIRVLAVLLELDGSERWRLADGRFSQAENRSCMEAGTDLICFADQADGNLLLLRVRQTDGTVQSERIMPGTRVGGPITPDMSDGVVLLRDGRTAVLYDPVADTERWSLDLSTWAQHPATSLWATAAGDTFILTAGFDAGDGMDWTSVSALVDPATGELQWRSNSWLGVHGGVLYETGFGPNSDGLRRLDDVGVPLWSVEHATVVGWSDGAPVTEEDGRLQLLDPDTGALRWVSAETYDDDISRLRQQTGGGSLVMEFGPWDKERTTVLLDPDSGAEQARYRGRLVAYDRERVHLQTGTYDEPGELLTVDRDGRRLWALDLPSAVPGGHPQVSTLLGRLVVFSDTHLLFLDPA